MGDFLRRVSLPHARDADASEGWRRGAAAPLFVMSAVPLGAPEGDQQTKIPSFPWFSLVAGLVAESVAARVTTPRTARPCPSAFKPRKLHRIFEDGIR